MLQEDVDPLQAMLKQNEGCEPSPYLDSDPNANITVGVGHEIPTLSAMQGLPFRLTETGLEADEQAIANGYNYLRGQARVPSSVVRRYPALFLADDEIDSLLMADLRGTDNYLHSIFPAFDSYPQQCRLALTDMSYNLGSLTHYPLLRASILSEDWATAANQCHRRGIGEGRNARTRDMFLSAVGAPQGKI